MTIVAILAHLGIAAGCGAVMFFFAPAIKRAARVSYGLNLHWSMWFAIIFFVACGFWHFLIAWQLFYTPAVTVHSALASGFSGWVAVVQALAILGEFVAVLYEVVRPFHRGWTTQRDEELGLLAKTIVQATRELREETFDA